MQIQQKINFDDSINSGQVFLWKKNQDAWYGVNGNNIISIHPDGKIKTLNKKSSDFFRNSDNIEEIFAHFRKDKIVKRALNHSPGLRLLRQEPFQCYVSFIISSNSSIQNIKRTLERLCQKFGEKVEFEKNNFSLFPEPERLANASNNELFSCGLGYRTKFVKMAAQSVLKGEIVFEDLIKTDYYNAKESLLQVFGIGDKVADCIMLFSLEKLDSFPLDRWMIRILQKYYSTKISIDDKSLTGKKYAKIHSDIVDYFGKYAGYAQQFLFKMERDMNQKKWL